MFEFFYWGFMLKKCSKCREMKNRDQFNKDKRLSDGLYPSCRQCFNITRRRRRRASGPMCYRRENDKSKYGLTSSQSDWVDQLRQHGRCFCCNEKRGSRKLFIDHDHKTNQVRGILCMRCNIVEGYISKHIALGKLEIGGWWGQYLASPPGIQGLP